MTAENGVVFLVFSLIIHTGPATNVFGKSCSSVVYISLFFVCLLVLDQIEQPRQSSGHLLLSSLYICQWVFDIPQRCLYLLYRVSSQQTETDISLTSIYKLGFMFILLL